MTRWNANRFQHVRGLVAGGQRLQLLDPPSDGRENIEVVMAAAGQYGVQHQEFGQRLGALVPGIQSVETGFQARVERAHVFRRVVPVDLEGVADLPAHRRV